MSIRFSKDNIIQWSHVDYLCKPWYSGIGSILMFHRVLPSAAPTVINPNQDLTVTPELLDNVIVYLKSLNYHFLSLDELAERLQSKQSSNRKYVVFTFDDGYKDNLTYGLPIFKKHQVPFTIYVTTSFPNGTVVLWWYLLEALVIQQSKIQFMDKGQTYTYACRSADEKRATFNTLRKQIIYHNTDNSKALLENIFAGYDMSLEQTTSALALSWDEIRQLHSDPLVTIGAHTLNHYSLKQLSDRKAIDEIQGSKNEIQAQLHAEVRHFAYPFGTSKAAGPRDYVLAKESGFATATTTCPGNLFAAHHAYMHALPRINIRQKKFGDNVKILRQHLNGLQHFIKHPFSIRC